MAEMNTIPFRAKVNIVFESSGPDSVKIVKAASDSWLLPLFPLPAPPHPWLSGLRSPAQKRCLQCCCVTDDTRVNSRPHPPRPPRRVSEVKTSPQGTLGTTAPRSPRVQALPYAQQHFLQMLGNKHTGSERGRAGNTVKSFPGGRCGPRGESLLCWQPEARQQRKKREDSGRGSSNQTRCGG